MRRQHGGLAGAWRRRPGGLGLVLAMVSALLAGLPAMAQTLAVSGACAQQCGAVSRQVRDNRPEIQACLIRCNATQEYDRASGAERVQSGQPASRTRSQPSGQAEARRSAPSVQPAPASASLRAAAPPRGSAAGQPGSTQAPVRGVPHAGAPPPGGRATPAATAAAAVAAAPGAQGLSAQSLSAQGLSARRWGVAYLAAAPATEFGLTAGLADRLTAHSQAQAACAARGAPCRAALEFTDRCGAVAQARRTLGLFRTADPRTYSVSYAAAGSGATRDAAESVAMDECRARERTTSCEVVASSCGRP